MPLLFVLLLVLQSPTAAALDASTLAIGPAARAAALGSDKLKGEPWRLAWSPNGAQLYVAGMKRKSAAQMELTHFVIDLQSAAVRKVDAEPPWAAEYWQWKSAQAAPGAPAFKISIDSQRKSVSATARPMGGSLARGGAQGDAGSTGTPIDDATAAANVSTNALVITLQLKGELLGEWVNAPMVPGLTFGWGPKGSELVAFASNRGGRDGKLVVMDEQGRKQDVRGADGVRLPAWSQDGKRLAWIEREGRKKITVKIAPVTAG